MLAHLDFADCFDLLKIPLPTSQKGILDRLAEEKLIVSRPGRRFDIAVESFQLPAPDFSAITTMQPGSTKAVLFGHRKLIAMDAEDRIRACYQHACLCHVLGQKMTNTSLRQRFGIEEKNAAKASRIIAEAVSAGRVKAADPAQGKKYASYLPFWA